MTDAALPVPAIDTIRLPSRWERLSTGMKMLIIMSFGLLPLGVLAIVASLDNVQKNQAKSEVEARALLAVHVQRFTLSLARNSYAMRSARDAIIETRDGEGICKRTLERLARVPNVPGRFALFGADRSARCASRGYTPPPSPASGGQMTRAELTPDGAVLRLFLFDAAGAPEGVAEYDRAVITQAVDNPRIAGDFGIELVQGAVSMRLRADPPVGHWSQGQWVDYPLANGQYVMRVHTAPPALSISDVLIILTPVLMWIWASVVGWVIVQKLLLRPLGRVQAAVSAYEPGDRALVLPDLRGPASEIRNLGQAFARTIATVARHEAELEAAVERQTRLVREVHHRVKNNLQVVASLLNLHARGARSDDVSAAYASIQRRVDALAVVHRNHYAELEDNRGVALKPLVSELAANLRATAPAQAHAMQIRLDIAPVYVNQDTAVSVAFLVTEIVEFGMLCGANEISVVLDADQPASALLSVEVDALAGTIDCDPILFDRFDRIITGLARQLRSALDRDPDRGRYAVRIATVGTGDD